MNNKRSLLVGVDIGSTTEKVVCTTPEGEILHTAYVRHNTMIIETLLSLLKEIRDKFGDVYVQIAMTGSAGMGIAESSSVLFVQEIIAAGNATHRLYKGVKSLIDIGGEDAKLVIFSDEKRPDIRMNGNCAGGTGAYIDQMAGLLNVKLDELDSLAYQAKKIYPIASRCGVFAKTDVQNLISRKIDLSDIAASIFHAVASQTVNSLARGCQVEPTLLFCGGPLNYIPYLRKAFIDLLKLGEHDFVVPERAELFTALGTAFSAEKSPEVLLSDYIIRLEALEGIRVAGFENILSPLFESSAEYDLWKKERNLIPLPVLPFSPQMECFLGIDSGSTTCKIVVTDKEGALLYTFYKNNNGKPLETLVEGLLTFREEARQQGAEIVFKSCAVTGYGEDLIKSALGLDYGLVETIAHFLAAQKIEPEVSFILDIGGQDIKAISIQSDTVTNIEINEACSSGCGSFIEGFANTLGYAVADFSKVAIAAEAPYDLGSRCTVFMNSKVKQALRDGATIPDLSAGLAYSVVKNCLNKVLKISNLSSIGSHVVVQGGTFRNEAVLRGLELLSDKKVVISDRPELMGAYGAAIYAIKKSQTALQGYSTFSLSMLDSIHEYETKQIICQGCTNSCTVTQYRFLNGKKCYSGNKCEKIFSSSEEKTVQGKSIFEFKKELLFGSVVPAAPSGKMRIGIPRILNMYENFPFWQTLFTECGVEVVLSDESSYALYKQGHGSIMSDSICFPAKLSHGHIFDLIEKKVDRIFYPLVVYEKKSYQKSSNSFNCPVITGYSEVLKAIPLQYENPIPFDSPAINFNNQNLLKKACQHYLQGLGISKNVINQAFASAIQQTEDHKVTLLNKNVELLEEGLQQNRPVVLVASHPYHLDKLIHQQVSQMLTDMGVYVINEEIAAFSSGKEEGFDQFFTISQWEYPNRVLQAAYWTSIQKEDIACVQLNSFGCGPDSFIMDEISELMKRRGKSYCLLRIDEIASPGSVKLRLRSLVESMLLKKNLPEKSHSKEPKEGMAIFTEEDQERDILVPWFSDIYSPFIPPLAHLAGYKMVNLPPSDKYSIEMGLNYANNDVCYPATLVVGDMLKALKSGEYDESKIAFGMTQTGGQCRATNYIALIKKALSNYNYKHIPVISVTSGSGLHNEQPGFRPKWKKALLPVLNSLLFCDSISQLYYSSACRETERGAAKKMRDHFIQRAVEWVYAGKSAKLIELLKEAVETFNRFPIIEKEVQKVGIVGEIYIKYNSFGQFNSIDWLIEKRVEVVIPPLSGFFMQNFINTEVYSSNYIEETSPGLMAKFGETLSSIYINRYEKVLKKFRYYTPLGRIRKEAKLASEVLSLSNQYGEGWLISAEIASMAHQNIQNVICMQPFGCIANHIIGKGVEKKLKELYPQLNLLFLDFDYGVSKVNILNRLQFLIQNIEG